MTAHDTTRNGHLGPDPDRRRLPGNRLDVRVRILATVLTLAAIGMALAGSIAVLAQLGQLRQHVDATLASDVEEFRALVEREQGTAGDLPGLLQTALQLQLPSQGETFLAVSGSRQWVSGAERPVKLEQLPEIVAVVESTPQDQAVRIRQIDTADAGPIRIAVVPVRVEGEPQTGMLVIGYPMRDGQQQVMTTARTYALVSVASLVLVGVIGWLVAGRLLRPLRLLRDATEHISHTDLSLRIPVSGHDDVNELTRTVNAMLDRLQAAFETQQTFLDDAGHELRTPLTIVQGHLEVLDVTDPDEVGNTRALVLDELARMGRLVDDLTVLAKSRRPGFLRPGPVDLGRLLDDVSDKAAALGQRRWRVDTRPGVYAVADPQRLTQALLQLADNAVRHTGPDDEIGFGAGLDDLGRVRLWVRDTGSGVRPEDTERIFERFGRAGEGRGDTGSGLGLAIVGAIAAAHGGRVVLDSRPGSGATFTLVLPVRPFPAPTPTEVRPAAPPSPSGPGTDATAEHPVAEPEVYP